MTVKSFQPQQNMSQIFPEIVAKSLKVF